MKVGRIASEFAELRLGRHSGLSFGSECWPLGKSYVEEELLPVLVGGRDILKKFEAYSTLENKSTQLGLFRVEEVVEYFGIKWDTMQLKEDNHPAQQPKGVRHELAERDAEIITNLQNEWMGRKSTAALELV